MAKGQKMLIRKKGIQIVRKKAKKQPYVVTTRYGFVCTDEQAKMWGI